MTLILYELVIGHKMFAPQLLEQIFLPNESQQFSKTLICGSLGHECLMRIVYKGLCKRSGDDHGLI